MWVFVKREHILKSKRNKGGGKARKKLKFLYFWSRFQSREKIQNRENERREEQIL